MAPTRMRQPEGLRLRTDTHPPSSTPRAFDLGDRQPPLKRPKYMPGGRGGGGRHVYPDGTEIAAAPLTVNGHVDKKAPNQKSAGFGSPARTRNQKADRRIDKSPLQARTTPRQQPNRRPNQTSASAVAAHGGNNNNPREEQSYQVYHPEFNIDMKLPSIIANEVDGTNSTPATGESNFDGDQTVNAEAASVDTFTPRLAKKRGRPKAYQRSELSALGNPSIPKPKPPPYGADPRERLDLNKPSFHIESLPGDYHKLKFSAHEREVGYHDQNTLDLGENEPYIRLKETNPDERDLNFRVEYDMDEQDNVALQTWNERRREARLKPVNGALFEIIITLIERYWFEFEASLPKPAPKTLANTRPRSSSAAAVNGEERDNEDRDANCCICDIGEAGSENPIVFCDGCDIAVHQYCYGVQHIPGGDWLCRKCWLVGRNTSVNCVLCPNTDGAFKTTSVPGKWAHVLCALWVSEISIGNTTVIEPINDVEKLPRDRLNLQCYICQQKMGAPVQCQQMGCFTAFHITCARRAGLYSTPMNSNSGSETLVSDSDQFRGYCHKHGSKTWRATHDVDATFAAAKKYYRETMKNVNWKNVLSSTPQISAANNQAIVVVDQSHRRSIPDCLPKTAYGADHVPAILLRKIENHPAVAGFAFKFGEDEHDDNFIGECCAYWTCKREARGNAPLIRRHNTSLVEQYPSLEVPRRDYGAMGAAGGPQLEERIQFTETLINDLDLLRDLAGSVREREGYLAEEAEILCSLGIALHHQLPDILQPTLDLLRRIFKQDKDCKFEDAAGYNIFRKGFDKLNRAVSSFEIDSVETFWASLLQMFDLEFGIHSNDGPEFLKKVANLQDISRPKRRLAKKLVTAAIPSIDDAFRKQAELFSKPYERRSGDSESIEEAFSRTISATEIPVPVVGERSLEDDQDKRTNSVPSPADKVTQNEPNHSDEDHDMKDYLEGGDISQLNQELAAETEKTLVSNTPPASMDGAKKDAISHPDQELVIVSTNHNPPTPPLSMQGAQSFRIGQGGIPWFAQAFDPDGITLQEERWSGRELMREMSEELSEMSDNELQDLGGNEFDGNFKQDKDDANDSLLKPVQVRRKNGKFKRRYRGFKQL